MSLFNRKPNGLIGGNFFMHVRAFVKTWMGPLLVCFLVPQVGGVAGAQPAGPGRAEVEKAVAEYAKAWNSGDVEALGRMWSADGEMIDARGQVVDRKALLAERVANRQNPRPQFSLVLDRVQLVEPNVAVIDGESQLATPDGTVLRTTRFTGMLVKQDNAWKIRMIRQLSSRQRQAAPENPLQDFEWMIGEWTGLGDGMKVHTSTVSDLDGRYLHLRTDYDSQNGNAFESDVRVGWDPELGALKSWYFDSRGVISTTVWQKDGDHWLGVISGTDKYGESFTGILAITKVDNDSYLRTMSNMKMGGKSVPNQELRMFRVTEQQSP